MDSENPLLLRSSPASGLAVTEASGREVPAPTPLLGDPCRRIHHRGSVGARWPAVTQTDPTGEPPTPATAASRGCAPTHAGLTPSSRPPGWRDAVAPSAGPCGLRPAPERGDAARPLESPANGSQTTPPFHDAYRTSSAPLNRSSVSTEEVSLPEPAKTVVAYQTKGGRTVAPGFVTS